MTRSADHSFDPGGSLAGRTRDSVQRAGLLAFCADFRIADRDLRARISGKRDTELGRNSVR